jgi:AcrR family transcriptional regulator
MTAEPAPDGRRTRWDDHRRLRREELVDAAVRAIRIHGPGVGMDDVAAAASTSKAAVYRYFADRGELYLAVCNRVSERLVDQLLDAIAAEPEPRRQLAAAIDAYLRVIETDPDIYRFVHRPSGTVRSVSADPMRDLSALVGAHVARLIAERFAENGLDSSPAGPWGHGIVGLVQSAADHWLDNSTVMTREALRNHLTDLAWGGLAGVLADHATSSSTRP